MINVICVVVCFKWSECRNYVWRERISEQHQTAGLFYANFPSSKKIKIRYFSHLIITRKSFPVESGSGNDHAFHELMSL